MADKCEDCGADWADHRIGGILCLRRQRQRTRARAENAQLRKQVKRLRGQLCIHCRSGDVPVNGRHCVESLSECEPNQFTDTRGGVRDCIICLAERDTP